MGYPKRIINKALTNAKYTFYKPSTRVRKKSKYHINLPSHPTLHVLRPALKQLDVSTAFTARNTLKSKLSRTGPPAPLVKDSAGSYKYECRVCPEGVYYGETGSSLAKRASGHKNDIRHGRRCNAMFVHMEDNPGHSFDLDNPTLLYKSTVKAKRQLVESSLIATNVNCNLKPGDFPVCKITAATVLRSLNIDVSKSASSLLSQPLAQDLIASVPSIDIQPSDPVVNSTSVQEHQPTPVNPPIIVAPSLVLPSSTLLPTSHSIAPSTVSTTPLSQRTRSKTRSLRISSTIPSIRSPYTPRHTKTTSFHSPSRSGKKSTPIALHTRSRILLSQAMALSFSQRPLLTPVQDTPSPSISRTAIRSPDLPILSQYSPPTAKTGAIPKRTSRHITKIERNNKTPYS